MTDQTDEKGKGGDGDKPQLIRFNLAIDVIQTDQGIVVKRVNGFPDNYMITMELMQQAQAVVGKFFIDKSQAGELDENLSIKKSMILTSDKNIVVPNLIPPKNMH